MSIDDTLTAPDGLSTTSRTALHRHKERGRADRGDLYEVLDSGLICHLGVVINGTPVVLPTAYGRHGDVLYLHGSSGETDASRFCRQKARDCQRAALTTTDPSFRFTFLQLAKLWRDMADARSNKRGGLDDGGVVVLFPKLFRSTRSAGCELSLADSVTE